MLLGCTATARKPQSCRFVIDWNSSTPDRERAIWLAYLMYRAQHAGPTNVCGSEETVVIPTFDQEVQARDETLKTYHRLQQHDPELDLAYFDDLSRVAGAGFMREYVWVYLRQKSWTQEPSGLRESEFEIWRESNLKGHVPQTQGAVKVIASTP